MNFNNINKIKMNLWMTLAALMFVSLARLGDFATIMLVAATLVLGAQVSMNSYELWLKKEEPKAPAQNHVDNPTTEELQAAFEAEFVEKGPIIGYFNGKPIAEWIKDANGRTLKYKGIQDKEVGGGKQPCLIYM